MSPEECKKIQELLSAYADGELDASQRAEVGRHLPTCPTCARDLENFTALKTAMQNEALLFAAPSALQKRIETLVNKAAEPTDAEKSRPSRLRFRLKPVAISLAAGVLLAAGIAASIQWWPTTRHRLEAEAVADYRQSITASHMVDIASGDPQAVLRWFGAQLPFGPLAPNRVPPGYSLVGGRVDHLAGQRVAVLVYRNGSQISNVFQWPSNAPASAANANSVQGLGVASWNMVGMNFYLVSDGGASVAESMAGTFVTDGCSVR